MYKRVILTTIIVGVAFMMLFSAVAPAMAAPGGKGGIDCAELFTQLAEKVGNERAIEIISHIPKCSG